MTLAEAVSQARRRRRLTLVEAAALTGVSDRHISFIERGLRSRQTDGGYGAGLDLVRRLSRLGFTVTITEARVDIDLDPEEYP